MQLITPPTQKIVTSVPAYSSTFLFRMIWLIFILSVFLYGLLTFFSNQNGQATWLIILSTLGLFAMVVFRYLVKNEQSVIAQQVEVLSYTLFVLASISLSGNIDSPFLFGLLLPILSTPQESGLSSPLGLALIESPALILISLIVNPNFLTILVSNVAKYAITFITPIIVGAIMSLLKKPFQIQQQQIEQEDENIQSLTQQVSMLQAILQSIQEAMLITDPAGNITFANQKSSQIFQVDVNGMVNQKIERLLATEDLSQNSFINRRLEVTNPLGKRLVLKVSSFPLIADALVRGKIFLIFDQTNESEFEKVKLDFVAQAAHQLRTPLTILRSYLAVLSDSIKPKLNPEDAVNLERAEVGASQLSMLIENLLNVSKVEGGKLDLHPQPSSLEQIIVSAINKNINNANQRQVKIFFSPLNPPLAPFNVDPHLIEQAISNLISNAVENSNRGGEINISLTRQPNFITVSVNDKGVGIPSEATNKLFNKFYKVSTNLVQATKGIGLGLFNTRAIIQAHGGTISVNSLLGKGSTFYFTLPIK